MTNGTGVQTHAFAFSHTDRSGKPREATRNDLQSISSDLLRLTAHQARPTAPQTVTNGTSVQTHVFAFFHTETQRKRNGNAAGNHGTVTNGTGGRTHGFAFFHTESQRKRSGNAAGSHEKQREATRNDSQSISSDLRRSTSQRRTREWF